jgi:hypothetical protein
MAQSRDLLMSGERPKTIADQQEIGELNLAWGHAMWRNNLVAKVFCYLSVMRAAGLIPAKSKALISPSSLHVPQDFQSTGNNQAAHYLPGFVAIEAPNSKPCGLWELVSDDKARRHLEDMFRATQDLNVSYNQADSAAEAKRSSGPPGLKQLFRECCQFVIDQRPPSRRSGDVLIVVDRPMVNRVFRRWAEGSIEAYKYAAGRKTATMKRNRPTDVRDEPRTDLGKGVFREWTLEDLAARSRDQERIVSGRKGSVQDFDDQESFVRAYANVTTSAFPLSESVIHEIEVPFGALKKPA